MAEYGLFVYIEDEMTEENIEQAKELVLHELVECMRNVAMKNPEFFIIKDTREGDPLSRPTVGAKFILPTVKQVDDGQKKADVQRG